MQISALGVRNAMLTTSTGTVPAERRTSTCAPSSSVSSSSCWCSFLPVASAASPALLCELATNPGSAAGPPRNRSPSHSSSWNADATLQFHKLVLTEMGGGGVGSHPTLQAWFLPPPAAWRAVEALQMKRLYPEAKNTPQRVGPRAPSTGGTWRMFSMPPRPAAG